MLKKEIIYREILLRWLGEKRSLITQKSLSEKCNVSLSTVNHALSSLEGMCLIAKKPMGFKVVDAKKILIHWANIRKFKKDIIYSAGFSGSVKELENNVPASAIFTAYSAYRLKYKDAPADYGEVYVYGGREEFEKRFPKITGRENLYVLANDAHLEKNSKKGIAPDVQVYVDLWNIGTWNANEFLKSLEVKLFGN